MFNQPLESEQPPPPSFNTYQLKRKFWVFIQLSLIFLMVRLVMVDRGMMFIYIPYVDDTLGQALQVGHEWTKSLPRYRINIRRYIGFGGQH